MNSDLILADVQTTIDMQKKLQRIIELYHQHCNGVSIKIHDKPFTVVPYDVRYGRIYLKVIY